MKRFLGGILLVGLVQCLAYGWALRTPDGFAFGCYDQDCYAQAARRLVAGHPFSYAPGQPVTTGQTSVLYPFLLALPMALGVEGSAINAASFALAVVFYLVFLTGWGVVIRRLFPAEGCGRFAAAALVALSGQCAYVAFTQSDQGLWMAVSAAAAAAAATRRRGLLLALLTLAPWVRPEGMMLVVSVTLVSLVCGAPLRRRVLVLPILSLVGVFALNFALTGVAQFSSVSDKGYFKVYPFALALECTVSAGLKIVSTYLCALPFPLRRFFAATSPVAAVGFWIGLVLLVRLAWRTRGTTDGRRAGILSFVLATAMGVGSTSQGGFSGLDFDRYLAWAMPVPLLIAAWGIDRLSVRIPSAFWRKLPLSALVVTTLCSPVAMVLMMRQVAPERAGLFAQLRRESRLIPPTAKVGSEDFIWAYSLPPDTPYRELSGIFTPDFRGCSLFYANGSEVLKQRPETRFDFWVAAPPLKKNRTPRRYAMRRQLYGLPLDASLAEPLVHRADWSPYDRARDPSVDLSGWRCTDCLDVCYFPHERAAERRTFGKTVWNFTAVRAVAARATDGAALVDAFVFVTDGEAFTLSACPGKDARLVLRTLGRVWFETESGEDGCCDYGETTPLEVSVDGRTLGTFVVPLVADTFTDFVIPVPGDCLTSPRPRFTVRGQYASFAWWLYQPSF